MLAVQRWSWAWWALSLACFAATALLAWPARVLQESGGAASAGSAVHEAHAFRWRDFLAGLAGYAMFGIGYIGYMTFVVALLREQGVDGARITLFYALLGVAVVASSRIWAGLLDRYRGGEPLAVLNALLGVATLLPGQDELRHLAVGLVYGEADRVNRESLRRCLDEAIAQCLGSNGSTTTVEQLPTAA